jgi:site-specific recombinase XerC
VFADGGRSSPQTARKIIQCGSLRDVQDLAGHASLATT